MALPLPPRHHSKDASYVVMVCTAFQASWGIAWLATAVEQPNLEVDTKSSNLALWMSRCVHGTLRMYECTSSVNTARFNDASLVASVHTAAAVCPQARLVKIPRDKQKFATPPSDP